MSRPGKSMPEILLAEVGRLRLLLLLQLLLMQMPRRKQRPTQRRRPLQSPKRNLMLLLYYHHLNQNNMPKEKGKEEKESQRAEVPVLVTIRRYHVTSISLRSLAGKERTVNTGFFASLRVRREEGLPKCIRLNQVDQQN